MSNYKRVLLKLSGEALAGDKSVGFDETNVMVVANQVKKLIDKGVQIGVVIGGGNFWRGRSSKIMDRTKADEIGMMATIMNALYTSAMFRTIGIDTIVQTPFEVGMMTERFSKDSALNHLKNGCVVFFAGGTGHPYFSTDTGAALRAIEIEAEVILLAKNIDGVYDSDPKTNDKAIKFDSISLSEVITKNLKVMDHTAAIMCLEHKMPMSVFYLNDEDSIVNAISDKINGTVVTV
ncbi:uridylate kinase [Petrocella atlantisensis]|uniref:Uridylate kinase n=1 Tax=Petrocella atlantisensis TaxID=2173034 RepID=A0A3P7RTT2_9FIRM|nr:UMP kinase [Petrocella atlantisensis]VDN46286.1 uridylate kinase [Petrocella atlantisensis]